MSASLEARLTPDVSLAESALLANKGIVASAHSTLSVAVLLRDSAAKTENVENSGAVEEIAQPESNGGILCDLVDIFRLQDFWKLLAMSILQNASPYGLVVFVTGPSMSWIFGEKAAQIGNLNCMIHPFVACLLAPAFGRWSDRHDRRYAVMLLIVGMLAPFIAFRIWGITTKGYWASYIIEWVSGPLRAGITGSPVLWALYSDKIPPEKRSLGFCLIFCLPAVWNLWWGPFNKYLLHSFPQNIMPIWWGIYFTGFALTLLTCWSLKPCKPELSEQNIDGETICKMFCQTCRLLCSNPKLMALCAALGFLTLADLAGGFNSTIIGFTLLDIYGKGANHIAEMRKFTYLTTTYPPVIAITWTITLGVVAQKYGGARVISMWLPLTCCLFGSFSVLNSAHLGNTGMYLYAGCVAIIPMSCFPVMTAVVTQVVPTERVGEALGCVSSCKSLMAFIAPTVMTAVFSAMGSHLELYVYIFPALGMIMFLAWPFVMYLVCTIRSAVTPEM